MFISGSYTRDKVPVSQRDLLNVIKMLMTTISILRSPSPSRNHLVVSSPVKPVLRKGEAVDLADIEGRREGGREGGGLRTAL